jgi:hypothetical protein
VSFVIKLSPLHPGYVITVWALPPASKPITAMKAANSEDIAAWLHQLGVGAYAVRGTPLSNIGEG